MRGWLSVVKLLLDLAEAGDAMYATLVVVGGRADKRQLSIKLPAVLGRSGQADLTIANLLISRKHCELREHEGVVLLTDLGSLNGTFCRDHRIQRVPLLPNDRFSIGPLTFEIQYQHGGDQQPDFQTAASLAAEVPSVELTEPIETLPVELNEPIEASGKSSYTATMGALHAKVRRSQRLAGFTHREAHVEKETTCVREGGETIKIDSPHSIDHPAGGQFDAPTSQAPVPRDVQEPDPIDSTSDQTH